MRQTPGRSASFLLNKKAWDSIVGCPRWNPTLCGSAAIRCFSDAYFSSSTTSTVALTDSVPVSTGMLLLAS